MKSMPALLVLLLTLCPVVARADESTSGSVTLNGSVDLHDRRDVARRAPVMPVSDAVAIALKRVPGTMLATAIETNDGIRTWQIDILATKGGKVRLWLNASNGDVLRTSER